MIDKQQRPSHWRKTSGLMAMVMAGLAVGVLLMPLLTDPLNRLVILSFPLGFYVIAQGAVIVSIVAAFWFANHQERLDRRHGAMEDI